MNNKISPIQRREFVKVAGATLGVNTLSGISQGVSSEEDRIHYSEARVVYDIQKKSPHDWSYPTIEVCSGLTHSIKEAEGVLQINTEVTSSKQRTLLEENNKIIKTKKFKTNQETSIEEKEVKSLVTGLDEAFGDRFSVPIVHQHTQQRVNMNIGTRDLQVESAGSKDRLSPGKVQQYAFTPISVDVELTRPTDQLVTTEEPIPDWRKARKADKEIKTIRVVPKLIVKNYGLLNLKFS